MAVEDPFPPADKLTPACRVVAPSRNVTLPVGVPPWVESTIAVKVAGWFKYVSVPPGPGTLVTVWLSVVVVVSGPTVTAN